MADNRVWGTLTTKQVEVLREFLQRSSEICPDADNKIDPADRKRIARVKILCARRSGYWDGVVIGKSCTSK